MARSRTPTTPAAAEGRLPFAGRAAARAESSPVEDAVFAATEALLQTTAFADLTVAQILTEAGISRTTFYRYFTSKHTVVSALLGRLQAELVDVMQAWFARGERPPEAAIADALGAVADVWARHRPVLRASTENWHAEPEIGEPWVAMMDRFTADIARQIDRERATGAAPAGVGSEAIARTLVWGSERMLYLAGFGLYGEGMEQESVPALVAMWQGTIYAG
jgi:AcrR family transcriptional regulator